MGVIGRCKCGDLRRLVDFTLTPALSQRERGPIFAGFKFEFDSIAQVDGYRKNRSVSSLSLWERAG